MRKRLRPPPPRVRDWKCGYVYHVYQRGNYKQSVFHDQTQIVHYLQRFDLLARRYDVRIHAFCIMSNHIHFVLEPTRRGGGISSLMQHLQSYHARWIHRALDRDGHLWKNRFRAKRVTSPAHYRALLLYVERNPVEAGLVRRAERYAYSSAAAHSAGRTAHRLQHGSQIALIHLHLDRWRLDCDDVPPWRRLLRLAPPTLTASDMNDAIARLLGRDWQRPLNPHHLPPPQPPRRPPTSQPARTSLARTG